MKTNLIKSTCKELGLTYKQLAEEIGVSEGALNNASSTSKISKQLEKSLQLLQENYSMKQDLQILDSFRNLLNKKLPKK